MLKDEVLRIANACAKRNGYILDYCNVANDDPSMGVLFAHRVREGDRNTYRKPEIGWLVAVFNAECEDQWIAGHYYDDCDAAASKYIDRTQSTMHFSDRLSRSGGAK
jgi:phage baseplate assembly protein gpV